MFRGLDPRSVKRRLGLKLAERIAAREISRLASLSRNTPTTTRLLGPPLRLVDAASFLAQYRTIFRDEQYRFDSHTPDPFILDCGANIGMASLYWKRLYPRARILAFEPDPEVFDVLCGNVERLGLASVEALRKAIWTSAAELPFRPDGADGGRLVLSSQDTGGDRLRVETVRLRDYLHTAVDMLKLDIEGAEVDVVLDCADRLAKVRHLIVEYHSFIGSDQRLDELLRAIVGAGFRFHILPDVVATQPFVRRLDNHGMDLQLDLFAYRT